jgi:pterin-4a-carbinolamine dehydratase
MKNSVGVLCLMVCLVFIPSFVLASNIEWNIDRLLEDSSIHNGYDPRVAISGNNVVTVWRQWNGSKSLIYATYSTDWGATWNAERLIQDNADHNAHYPQVAISGNNVVVVWWDESADRIYADYSTDGGVTWHSDQLIDGDAHHGVYDPQIAISGNTVVAIWRQRDGPYNCRIYTNYSSDGGATWHSAQLIEDNTTYDGYGPRVAIWGDNVVAMWIMSDTYGEDSDRLYADYSTDGGATWHSDQEIHDDAEYFVGALQLAMYRNNVVAAWDQSDGVHSNYSTDGGASWHTEQLVQTNADHDGYGPQIAISGSNVVVVWVQQFGSDPSSFPVLIDNSRIYSNYSTDGGATWHSDQLIEDNAGHWAGSPRVAISGTNVVAVWHQKEDGIERIYSNYSTDVGATWHPDHLIEDNIGSLGYSPCVAMYGRNVVAVWQQMEGNNWRIYSNYGVFQGTPLSVPAMNEIGIAAFMTLGGIGCLFCLRRRKRDEN